LKIADPGEKVDGVWWKWKASKFLKMFILMNYICC